MDIRRIGAIKDADSVVGNRTRIKVVKNKVAAPFREIEFDIMYGSGISKEGDVLDLAVKENVVEKAGAWYSYNNAKIGQGRENSKKFFMDNPEIMQEIRTKVLAKHGLATDPDAMSAVDMATGEISDEIAEEAAPVKKSKKTKKLQ
jgi:recombination protein RecA